MYQDPADLNCVVSLGFEPATYGRRRASYGPETNGLVLQFLVFTMAGWINRGQAQVIDYLRE